MNSWGEKKKYMTGLNNYKGRGGRRHEVEDGKEVDGVMCKIIKYLKKDWRERQEVPTETDMSHTSKPDTQSITFLSLSVSISFFPLHNLYSILFLTHSRLLFCL